jgi:tetratricopeptide (TPR) repeat protein
MSNERGHILYQTGRYEAAEQEFRAALGEDSSNALAHAMLGLCLTRRKSYDEATAEAHEAIRLRPDWHFGYSVLAHVMLDRDRLKPAAEAIIKAIEIDPFNAGYHGVLATIRLQQRLWPSALASADAGLQIDPENQFCLNARAQALVKLGRRDEASATIQGALRNDPENATTHANQGWAMLHAGDHREALVHFREALRIDPQMQWAKSGMVEALQARNIVYRLMLKYFLFMGRLRSQAQWAIVLGGYFGYQALLELRRSHPEWSGIILPVIIAYAVFAIMTWIARPLFNLMLRLHPYGRYALSREQTMGANLVGGTILLSVTLAITGLVMHNTNLLTSAVCCAMMLLPVSAIYSCPAGYPRRGMGLYTLALGLTGVGIAIIGWFVSRAGPDASASLIDTRERLITVFLFGAILSGWVANGLIMMRVKK